MGGQDPSWASRPEKYAYVDGASLVDERSGLRATGHSPALAEAPWRDYLDGASARYRVHGFEHVLGRPALDRDGCALFWSLHEDERLVGGVRAHGPHDQPEAYAAVHEMRESPSIQDLHAAISRGIPEGVVEIKGAWTSTDSGGAREIARLIARLAVHSARWLRCRFALCTSDRRIARAWRSSGARVISKVSPVPFPDKRFSTVPLWWDLSDMAHVAPEVLARLRLESELLAGREEGREGLVR